jgi:tryptophan-rich sensory protein
LSHFFSTQKQKKAKRFTHIYPQKLFLFFHSQYILKNANNNSLCLSKKTYPHSITFLKKMSAKTVPAAGVAELPRSLPEFQRLSPANRLSPSASLSSSSKAPKKFVDSLTDRKNAILSVAALAVFVLLVYIVNEKYPEVHAWARLPAWLANPIVTGFLVLVTLLLAAFATAAALSASGNGGMDNAAVGVLFVLVAAALLLMAYQVYRLHNFVAAFYTAIVMFLLVLAHLYYIVKAAPAFAVALIPLGLFSATAVYLLWYMADESSANDDVSPLFQI